MLTIDYFLKKNNQKEKKYSLTCKALQILPHCQHKKTEIQEFATVLAT